LKAQKTTKLISIPDLAFVHQDLEVLSWSEPESTLIQ